MDFNGPGTSLFQGTELNTFDNNAQREEEEEALEEQRRRNAELKDILEDAFDDVSFDNEECSGYNLSINQSNSNSHSKSTSSPREGTMSNSISSPTEFGKKQTEENAHEFHTPVRHTRCVRSKALDFNNHYSSDNYSDQYRIKQQNGSLHDIVDASGGGGDAGTPLQYNHCSRPNSIGDCKKTQIPGLPSLDSTVALYQNSDYNIDQLPMLYDIRVREVHRLAELIDKMRNEHEIEKTEYKSQLALSLAENERHKMSSNDLQTLLISSKEETERLKKEVNSLKMDISNMEKVREELLLDLETSRGTVNSLERKLLAIEKGRKDRTPAVEFEQNLREVKEKHAVEIGKAFGEINNLKTNLEEKTRENEDLKHKYLQLSQLNDENIAKKSEIIHRLSKQIEETQEQCEKLMKDSVSEENLKLKMEINFLREENGGLQEKIENLERSLANQEIELRQYESLGSLSSFDSKELSDLSSGKENEYTEINRKLREELFRALNSQKSRRQEIQSLQNLLKKKDEQIHCMAEKEQIFLTEAAKFREQIGEQISELKKYESLTTVATNENKRLQETLENTKRELESALKSLQDKCQEKEEQNKTLQEELVGLRNMVEDEKLHSLSKYNEEFMKFHDEGVERAKEELRESIKMEMIGKDIQIEKLKEEVEELKNLYVELYQEKETLMNQIAKDKLPLSRSNMDVEEVKQLQKELEKSRQRILDLDLTLRQQYQQEVEKLNGDIRALNLELDKVKKQKDHELNERDKLVTENELLKREVEQVTSEKNLYFLNCETLNQEIKDLKKRFDKLQDNAILQDECSREIQEVKNMYEIKIQKLNKEIELLLTRSISTESKYTSPMKSIGKRNVGTQGSPVSVQSVCTSPLCKPSTQESCTSPVYEHRKDVKSSPVKGMCRDISMATDPEPNHLTKREVVRMMKSLGVQHEQEMNAMENKYKMELVKMEKKWQAEVDLMRETVKVEMLSMHAEELRGMKEKHRVEMENRIEQERKEAVVALITEWACEVQALKQSQAEALAEAEKMKMKYKSAKNLALRYKSYFTSKAEHMKEEWRKAEDGYERALKELEKNVHMLVDVREDEVKSKVETITRAYEEKISRMRNKLEKYEDILKNEMKIDRDGLTSSKTSTEDTKGERSSDRNLIVPSSQLYRKPKQNGVREPKPDVLPGKAPERKREHKLKKLLEDLAVAGHT